MDWSLPYFGFPYFFSQIGVFWVYSWILDPKILKNLQIYIFCLIIGIFWKSYFFSKSLLESTINFIHFCWNSSHNPAFIAKIHIGGHFNENLEKSPKTLNYAPISKNFFFTESSGDQQFIHWHFQAIIWLILHLFGKNGVAPTPSKTKNLNICSILWLKSHQSKLFMKNFWVLTFTNYNKKCKL